MSLINLGKAPVFGTPPKIDLICSLFDKLKKRAIFSQRQSIFNELEKVDVLYDGEIQGFCWRDNNRKLITIYAIEEFTKSREEIITEFLFQFRKGNQGILICNAQTDSELLEKIHFQELAGSDKRVWTWYPENYNI